MGFNLEELLNKDGRLWTIEPVKDVTKVRNFGNVVEYDEDGKLEPYQIVYLDKKHENKPTQPKIDSYRPQAGISKDLLSPVEQKLYGGEITKNKSFSVAEFFRRIFNKERSDL